MGHKPEIIAAYEPGRICTCNGCLRTSPAAAPVCAEELPLIDGANVEAVDGAGAADGADGGADVDADALDGDGDARRLPSTVDSAVRIASNKSATENAPGKKACCATEVRSNLGYVPASGTGCCKNACAAVEMVAIASCADSV